MQTTPPGEYAFTRVYPDRGRRNPHDFEYARRRMMSTVRFRRTSSRRGRAASQAVDRGAIGYFVRAAPSRRNAKEEAMQAIRHPAGFVPTLAVALLLAAGVPADLPAQREARDNEYAVNDPRVQHRTYVMEETGETIPYALFVPSSYDPAIPAPLMVSLHGAGRQYDWLMNYAGFLDLAEHHGYVVVTPLGYTRRGGYGYRGDSEQDRRAEQDVMNVFELVTDELDIDENRIYLWGHSMGGAGTYYLASRYPDTGLVLPRWPAAA